MIIAKVQIAIIKIIIITDKMTVTDINIHPNLKILNSNFKTNYIRLKIWVQSLWVLIMIKLSCAIFNVYKILRNRNLYSISKRT